MIMGFLVASWIYLLVRVSYMNIFTRLWIRQCPLASREALLRVFTYALHVVHNDYIMHHLYVDFWREPCWLATGGWQWSLRKTCPKCGAVVQCMRRGWFVIVAMPLRVKGGHVAVMIVSLRKLPNAEGLHFSAFHLNQYQSYHACHQYGRYSNLTISLASIPLQWRPQNLSVMTKCSFPPVSVWPARLHAYNVIIQAISHCRP